jgi:hypothetical protein
MRIGWGWGERFSSSIALHILADKPSGNADDSNIDDGGIYNTVILNLSRCLAPAFDGASFM